MNCIAICMDPALNPTSAFVHLPEQRLFLTLSSHTVATWDFKVCVISPCMQRLLSISLQWIRVLQERMS
jgi:hypothetical protein